jgi:hypothetical protein
MIMQICGCGLRIKKQQGTFWAFIIVKAVFPVKKRRLRLST